MTHAERLRDLANRYKKIHSPACDCEVCDDEIAYKAALLAGADALNAATAQTDAHPLGYVCGQHMQPATTCPACERDLLIAEIARLQTALFTELYDDEYYDWQEQLAAVTKERDEEAAIHVRLINALNLSTEHLSSLTCAVCNQPMCEFVIENADWNTLVRRDGEESEKEYLCIACFGKMAAETARHYAKERDESLTACRARGAEIEALRAENARLREALEDIANPLERIKKEAAQSGGRLDGTMVNKLCSDANWLREKAQAALDGGEG